jgi:hypothetical protein
MMEEINKINNNVGVQALHDEGDLQVQQQQSRNLNPTRQVVFAILHGGCGWRKEVSKFNNLGT